MKHYLPRTFSLAFSFFLLATLIWSGTVVAETGSDLTGSAQPACTYNASEFKIGKAPAEFTDVDNLINYSSYSRNAHIASEDWLTLRWPNSNVTNCYHHSPTESDVAYASPATPNTNTTHTVTSEINQSVSELEKFSVEYDIGPELNSGVYVNNISMFGIDENKDGFIETSLEGNVEYVTVPSSNTIQFSLNGNATVPSNSYLVIQYGNIQNPDHAGTYSVDTTITGNRTSIDSGFIRYGKNVSKLIGENSATSISSFSRNGSQLATLRPAKRGFTNGSMYMFLPAQSNQGQPQTYSLSINRSSSGTSMSSKSNNHTQNITVFDRYLRAFSNAKIEDDTITINGYTNIAPGTLISVQVFDDGRLRQQGTIVKDSQTWSVNISLPDELLHSDILNIHVIDYDREMLDQRTIFTRYSFEENE